MADITCRTQYSITLSGRVHSYEDGPNRYSVTVIDFSDAKAKHRERVARCRAAGRNCFDRGDLDLRGAIVYATWRFLQRDAEVTELGYWVADFVEGHQLQLGNADGSKTFAAINMHENRLYIVEGTVPANSPPPALFQQSIRFLDEAGTSIRYESIYSNGFPPPPRVR